MQHALWFLGGVLMPTYEYRCGLGHVYEETRSMTEEQRLHFCPVCGNVINRVFSTPPITFKGKGFYSNGG
jgi:putative FmdB family regulatory protein